MMLRYTGDGKRVSFVTNKYYEAKKIHDDLGEGYAIFDEGDDWYRYGVNYVERNFDVENAEIESTGSVAV